MILLGLAVGYFLATLTVAICYGLIPRNVEYDPEDDSYFGVPDGRNDNYYGKL